MSSTTIGGLGFRWRLDPEETVNMTRNLTAARKYVHNHTRPLMSTAIQLRSYLDPFAYCEILLPIIRMAQIPWKPPTRSVGIRYE